MVRVQLEAHNRTKVGNPAAQRDTSITAGLRGTFAAKEEPVYRGRLILESNCAAAMSLLIEVSTDLLAAGSGRGAMRPEQLHPARLASTGLGVEVVSGWFEFTHRQPFPSKPAADLDEWAQHVPQDLDLGKLLAYRQGIMCLHPHAVQLPQLLLGVLHRRQACPPVRPGSSQEQQVQWPGGHLAPYQH